MASVLVKLVGTYVNALSYVSKTRAANTALALFSKPRKGAITETQAAFLKTSITEKFQYQSTQITTYKWTGNKQTILLVHGWESNSGRWKPLINHLKKEAYNIIALDAPAHGNSGSNRFNAIMYSEWIHIVAEKYRPNIIIGHSVGAMATVFFQNKHPLKCVEKLVLLGSPSNFKDILKRYTDMLGYNQRVIKQLNTLIEHRFGAPPELFSTAISCKTITAEALIIHDKYDSVIPYEDALQIKGNFKNSKLITTEGLGHSLNHKTATSHISKFIEA